MEHFTLYQKPEKVWREFILPFLSQFIHVVIAINLHRLFVGRGSYILPQVTYLGELTLPTAGRLIYAVSALILSIVLSFVASGLARKKRWFHAFLVGIFAGILLWQALGEDLWHFGLYEDGELINFLRLESIQVLPIVLPFLLLILYGMLHKSFDFGVLCVILSFLCNWMGHYCSHATYPIVESVLSLSTWYLISGAGFGGVLFLVGLYLGLFASKDIKARLFSSIVMYIGVAIFAFGVIES